MSSSDDDSYSERSKVLVSFDLIAAFFAFLVEVLLFLGGFEPSSSDKQEESLCENSSLSKLEFSLLSFN